jgi:UDP-N-acetylmuramate: L-alanyl-gamma-D-glutamyl-meso-diaminopimelate ligase
MEPGKDTPEYIFSQSVDKQRIVLIGTEARTITSMITHVLRLFNREFDLALSTPVSSVKLSLAPIVLIEKSGRPTEALLKYNHHIGVISNMLPDEGIITRFADATPKGGTLFYADTEDLARICKKDRPDVTAIACSKFPHVVENNKLILLSSAKERFVVKASGDRNLINFSIAKEVLKKIGITSEQFYQSMISFEG